MPDVAVVIAAYNAEATIVAAVESVLAGTMPCSVYIVDDNSAIPAEISLGRFAGRVQITRLDRNVGPAAARNIAMTKVIDAGFKYVAIMDADDISFPSRIEKQFAFLEKHPEIAACGTWVREFDPGSNETRRIFARPSEPAAVRDAMFFNIGLAHPSAMIRCDVLKSVGLYSTTYPVAEDYELMRRIGARFDLANIPECLLHYRISPEGASQRRRQRQLFDRLLIQIRYFELANWRAWAGISKTLVSILIPEQLVQKVKMSLARLPSLGRYRRRSTAQD
jgi:glycosyltransferase involved in cell wall biosynthesis